MAPKVLVSDKLSETAVQIFRDRGIEVDFDPSIGKDKDKLLSVIDQYDGLAIRSATKATEKIINAASNLKVIGRAGIGVDNIDRAAASKKGVIVMNTPFGNMITTAEHAIAMMFAVARQIPEASASTHAGKWEKSKFMGVELTGKTLGVIGAGNIGGIVCERALGLKMKVVAYDPFLSQERAEKLGVQKVDLDELLARADFITLHVPKTEQTSNILNAEAIAKMKPGVRVINCARGGLVDEVALAEALKSGHVAGAAFDVFEVEPATDSPLFNLPNVVCTPHLGAATTEAQENVAVQVAEQMSDYLLTGAVTNALNMPSVTAEEAKTMGPWLALAGHLGAFIGQMTSEPIKAINILYDGTVASMNLAALNCGVVAGIMKAGNPDVNMVSAPVIAEERGIKISTTNQNKSGVFDAYIKVTVVTQTRERSVAGTVFSDGKPRFIQIKGINVDAEIGRHMLYTT
ncbi:MAG: phosphoglycerate dehydrogenase, partial [Planktomarina temperata]|nr:phosphoglycerate dehydrogenase [Planktomarina temperata]